MNFEGYHSHSENIEAKTPEKAVEAGIAAVEARQNNSSFIAKEGLASLQDVGKIGSDMFTLGMALTKNIVIGLFKFAKEMIVKKGNVGFSKGAEIGKEMFSFKVKKEKTDK